MVLRLLKQAELEIKLVRLIQVSGFILIACVVTIKNLSLVHQLREKCHKPIHTYCVYGLGGKKGGRDYEV